MNNKGFVKLPRDITNKPWYNHNATLKVYIELLINAAWKDFEYDGATLKKGQFITSIGKLAERCQLSVQQTRTALSHLKSTNTITIDTTSKYSIITVLDDTPADESNKPVNELANNQSNTPINNRNRKEEKEDKTEIKEKEEAPSLSSFNSPNPSITRDELVNQYGSENVDLYEMKFDNWAAKKGINDFSNMYKTIARWLAEDKVQKLRGSSFDMGSEWQKIISRYNT